MTKLALATAAFAFPCILILSGVSFWLRKRRPSVFFHTVGAFLGLGLLTIVLGEIWCMTADRWLLGRVNLGFYYAFITAALPEECFRFLAIHYGLRRRPHLDVVSSMLLGSLVGLTFATYEHILYAVSSGWETWLARSFTSVPYHTLSGAILGYAGADFLRSGRFQSLRWLGVLIIVHGVADWPLDDPTSQEPDTLSGKLVVSGWAGNIASMVVALFLATVLLKKALRLDAANAPSQSERAM